MRDLMVAAALLVTGAGMLAAADEKAHSCPMAAAQNAVDQRHDSATGVAHEASVHHFRLDPQGGRIRLEATDAGDTGARDRIRGHLAHIARAFAEGDFELPMLIHDRVPPGVDTMKRMRAAIRYSYRATANGGEVRIVTKDPEALQAVHDFLRFQIQDHRTGDPLEVAPRR